jgi:hypothetical protein
MKLAMQAALLAAAGTALLAQVQVPPLPPLPPSAGQTFTFVSGELVGGSMVKNAPYSAEAVTESTQTLADGTHIVNRNSAQVYRDNQGRERREQSLPALGPFAAQGQAPKTILISDPVSGMNYTLDPLGKFAVKLPAPPMPPTPPGISGMSGKPQVDVMVHTMGGQAGMMAGGTQVIVMNPLSATNPPKIEQLGSKSIEGLQADGTRTTVTIPAGQMGNDRPIEMVDEVWRSSDLQLTVYSEHSDPRMGKTVYSLKNVSRAEPSPTLFQVPADYTLKDSKANMRFERRVIQGPQQ